MIHTISSLYCSPNFQETDKKTKKKLKRKTNCYSCSKPTEYNCWDTNFSTGLTVGVSSREDRNARGTGCSNLGEIWVEMQKNHVVVLSHLLNNGQACMYVCMSYGIHSGVDKRTHFAEKNSKPKWNSTVCAYSKREDEKWKRNWAMVQNEISPIVTLNLIRTLMQISIKHWLEVTDFEHQSPIFANNRINPACWADGHFSWCIRWKWRDESESKQKHSLKFLQIRIRIGLNETWFIQPQWISLAVC